MSNRESSAPHGTSSIKHNLKGLHELLAAYTCERYEQITHHPAPINGGSCYQLDRHLDQEAQVQISYELGHGRIDVVSAHEQDIRYGTVPSGRSDWVTFHAPASLSPSEGHSSQVAISNRWHQDNPWTWQQKHLAWFLNHDVNQHAESMCYYYLLTMHLLTFRLGKS